MSDYQDITGTRVKYLTSDPTLESSYEGQIWYNSSTGVNKAVVAIEDNSYVKKMLDTKVSGDVMVIDGNGSLKCALLGDNLAKKAHENGWAGFIIYGCIRDSKIIETIDIGIKAIGTMPVKSLKKDVGEYGKDLNFAGIVFRENEYVYSDDDGIITSENIIKVL